MTNLIHNLVQTVLDAPAWLVYLVVGLVVFAEDALFVGFVLPGETLAIIGGVTASLGHTSLFVVWLIVVVAAIVGDSVGYEIGRHFGPKVVGLRIFNSRRHRLESAQDFLARRGGSAVFLGRWTAFFRAVMPALAGLSGMKYRVFLPWNALGGIAWGTAAVLGGYLAGQSYARVEKWLGTGAAVVVGVVVIVAIAVWAVRRRRAESREEHEFENEPDGGGDPSASPSGSRSEAAD
jgi:membrane protein DedA with SNARE-associated domain